MVQICSVWLPVAKSVLAVSEQHVCLRFQVFKFHDPATERQSRKTFGCLLQQSDHFITPRVGSFTARPLPFLSTPDVCIFSPLPSQGVYQLQLYTRIFPLFDTRLQRHSPFRYIIMIVAQDKVKFNLVWCCEGMEI